MSDTGSQESAISAGISAADVLQQLVEDKQAPEASETVSEAATEVETEAKPEQKVEESKESKQEKLFASKFAALSRKEKALRQKERELEARMAQIEQQLKGSAPKEEPKVEEPLELRIKKNPFETLKSMGLDYEALTKIALNDGQLPPELQVQLMREEMERSYAKRFEELEQKLTEKEKRESEEKHNQVISNFKAEISDFVTENTANLELLSVEGQEGVNLVYDVIEEHYNEHGEILDVKVAAELVEEYLLEEAKKRVGLSKVKKLMGASEPKAQVEPKQTKPSVTLSNEQSQTSQPADRFLSDDESKQLAAKLIKWVE